MIPKQLVESIYSEKAKRDSNSRDLARSLELLAKTVFGEMNRFIFELLQNADDSPVSSTSQVDVSLCLTDNFLTFSHNGKHFSAADVKGISSVASRSSQKDRDQEKTGYKGIGFKSVFGSSDEVYISSGGYVFRYDKNHENWQDDEYPWQIIPIWTDDLPVEVLEHINSNWVNTAIRLKDKGAIAKELDSVFADCQIILFLRNVHKVSISAKGKIVLTIEKRSLPDGSIELLKNGVAISSWLIRNSLIEIPSELHDKLSRLSDAECPEKLKTADSTKLTFAAQTRQGEFVAVKGSYLYCYLPTRVGRDFAFLINGDFLTNAERTNLLGNIWNSFLFEQIAINQLIWLKELHETDYRNQVLKLFRSKFAYPTLSIVDVAFNDALQRAIDTTGFLPNIQNKFLVRATDLMVDPFGSSEKFEPNTIVSFFNTQRVILPKEITGYGAISDYTKTLNFELICKFVSGENTPNREPNFSANAIFFFCSNTLSGKNGTWLPKLKEIPFIPDEHYTLKTPRELYFPVQLDQALLNDLGNIHFMHPEVLSLCEKYQSVVEWLQSLGIRLPSETEIVRKTIIPLVQSNKITIENAFPLTRLVFKVFKAGHLSDLDYLALKNLKLVTQNGLQGTTACYLPDEFEPAQKLSNILVGASFVSSAYAENSDDRAQWGLFLKKLSVRDSLTIAIIPEKIERTAFINSYPHSKPYFEWLDETGAYPELYMKYRDSGQHSLKNFTEVAFREFLKKATFSKMFWNQILQNWESFKQQCNQTTYYYWGGSSQVPSYVQFFVKNEPCIPCTDLSCHKGSAVFTPSFKNIVNGVFPVADLDVLTKEQEAFLGIKSSVSLRDCLKILDWVSKQPFSSEGQRKAMAVYDELIALSPFSESGLGKEITSWLAKGKLLAENNSFQPASSLFCFSVKGMQPPVDSEQFLKVPKRMSLEEAKELCRILHVPFITYQELSFVTEEERAETSLKETLLAKAVFLAAIVSQKEGDEFQLVLARLERRLNEVDFTTAKKLSLIYSSNGTVIYAVEIDAWIGENRFTYKGSWESPLQRYAVANQLCAMFKLDGLEREVELLLQLTGNETRSWLESKGYELDSGAYLESTNSLVDEIQPELTTVEEDQPKISIETAKFEPSVQPTDIDFTHVQPSIKTAATISVSTGKAFGKVDSETARIDIGRWSEQFVFNYLKENQLTFSEIEWMNEVEESNKPYDFLVKENGETRYIEVKGTPSKDKDAFYLSQKEWQIMVREGKSYSLFRLFEVGSKNCRLERLDNPMEMIEKGLLLDFPIEIRT